MLTTILVLILGIFFITAASRYYEDEKLFWKLAVPFIGAYTLGVVMFHAAPFEKPSEQTSVTQVHPMQVLDIAPSVNIDFLADAYALTTVDVAASVPAGSEDVLEENTVLDNLEVINRENPVWKEPPILVTQFFDTS